MRDIFVYALGMVAVFFMFMMVYFMVKLDEESKKKDRDK